MIEKMLAFVAAGALLLAAFAWIMRARVKDRLRDREAADLAAEQAKRDAEEKKKRDAEAAQAEEAGILAETDAQIEARINK